MSPTTITVSVIADTGSSLRPGLFQGSVDGVKAWADYMNANGGLACRQVVVKALDSKLSGDDAKNAITTACGNSLALVGTTALFLDDMTAAEQCKDKAGAPTGMPDMAVLQTYAAAAVLAGLVRGAAVGRLRARTAAKASARSRSPPPPSTTTSRSTGRTRCTACTSSRRTSRRRSPRRRRIFAADKQEGIKDDAEFGASAGDTQSEYTPFVQAIKTEQVDLRARRCSTT